MHKRNMLDVFFVSMFLLSVLTINVSKVKAATPRVSVQPSNQTVGQEGVLLPTPPFTINITVQGVADLYMWQIYLYYNSTLLSTRDALIILPLGHVFEGKTFYQVGPYIENDSKGTYIALGATLKGGQTAFTGSGILCQIQFIGQAKGTSWLNLGITTDGRDSTLLGDHNANEIPCETSDGQVTVTGIENPREPSTITINVDLLDVDPSTPRMEVGSNVIITGTINPTRAGVNVTIHCIRSLLGTLATLATVQTNEFSRYEYNWTTEEAGEYKLSAYWPGDANYTEATSNIATVTVDKWQSTISLNIYPTKVPVGSNVTINGTISTPKPTLPYEKVTIEYKRAGAEAFTPLATVYPNEDGVYTYTSKINETGSFKASWPGDKYSDSAESNMQTVEVTGESNTYLFYIIAAIAIIAIATIGIYFTKIRKRH